MRDTDSTPPSIQNASTGGGLTAATLPIYRLTVEQYHGMVSANILTEEDRVELLGGWLVPKVTKRQPHNVASGLINDSLSRMVPAGYYVAREEPFVATPNSEPEPDVMVVRGSRNDYPDEPPQAANVTLVVEVAEATLARDQGERKRLYAEAKIPIYWLANLAERCLEVYTDPVSLGAVTDYRTSMIYGIDGNVPVIIDERTIGKLPVRELFPHVKT
jgi:Uma2 family endonuclease